MKLNFEGTSIYYKIVGKGKPILLLHGWQSSSESFSILVQQLKSCYKLILVDFPPFGKSGKLLYSWDLSTYTNMIIQLLNHLKLQNFYILAHSFGGRVAINLCNCYNINVEKLILTGSAGLKPKPSFLNYLKIKKYKWLKKKNKFEKLARYGSNDFKALDNLMRKSFVKIVNTHQDNFVKKIKVPTLIIYGKNDKETPVYMAKKFNKLIKNSKLCLLKDSGHFCFVQKPEAFYDLIIHFLTD